SAPFAMALSKPPDYRIVEVNDTFLQIFGFARDEVIGKTEFELDIVSDPQAREHIARLMQERNTARHFGYTSGIKGGALMPRARNLNGMTLSGERYVLNTIEDVTERKRVEERLRRLQEVTARFATAEALDEVRQVILGEVLTAMRADGGALR